MSSRDVPPDPVQVFRALGHPARLTIVQTLAGGEHCVNDLRAVVGSSWSTVSQHLAVLRHAGVVASHKRGNQVLYHLALPCVGSFTACLAAVAAGSGHEACGCSP